MLKFVSIISYNNLTQVSVYTRVSSTLKDRNGVMDVTTFVNVMMLITENTDALPSKRIMFLFYKCFGTMLFYIQLAVFRHL